MMVNATAIGLLWTGLLFGADPARLLGPPERAPRDRAVIPVEQATPWVLGTQEKSFYPEAGHGVASTPSSTDGLSITILPERGTFDLTGPFAFRVVLKNTSEKTIRLRDPANLGGAQRKLVISNQKTGAQWTIADPPLSKPSVDKKVKKVVSKTLEPGETMEVTLVVRANVPQVRPRPPIRPIPQPRPLPGRLRPELENRQPVDHQSVERVRAELVRDQVQPPRRALARKLIIGRPIVRRGAPCGHGPCRARLFLEFTESSAAANDGVAKFWTGKLASGVVDFGIANGAAVPRPRRELPPVKGQPRLPR